MEVAQPSGTLGILLDSARNSTQAFTPSSVLSKGQLEVKWFNNLYSGAANFDADGNKQDGGARGSYFYSTLQSLYGIGGRVNVGAEVWFRGVRAGVDKSEWPTQLFRFEGGTVGRNTFTYIGPRIKITPFRFAERFSIQSAVLFQTASEPEGFLDNGLQRPWIEWNSDMWLTQFFYDKSISPKFQFFTSVESWARIHRSGLTESHIWDTPIKAFISYFPNTKFTIYSSTTWWPSWRFGEMRGLNSWFGELGIGGKYQIIPALEVEALYTNFLLGENGGAGHTINFGLRYIKL
jgi:hypothetical protein